MRAFLVVIVFASACVGSVAPKFPDDVAAAVARDAMRRMETDTFVIYYPARRHDQALRFAARAEGCGQILRSHARLHNRFFLEKPILVLPDAPFNNAYVSPPALGEEDYAVVPTYDTFDFATELGIPPDPGYIACHELTHYAHDKQIAGLWGTLDLLFGPLISPQVGLDSWFWEGLATHYESALQPGAGRPRWPIFTGMFAAAYAGHRLGGGDLSELNREPPPGGNYLVGTMFIDFLVRRYGDEPLWRVIEEQASSWSIVLAVNGRFKEVYGKSLSDLIDEFADETAQRFPVRRAPAGQRRLRVVGDDARYARGADGTEAVIANDVDVPTHLDVFGPDGARRASVSLVGVVPPRTLVTADPILVSGLGVTRAGDVYFTTIDQGATYQVTRLLRWRGGSGLEEVATDLGPGACVTADGRTYFYLEVDGDRWSLARYEVATGARKIVTAMPPGQYALGAQLSPDGTRLVASVWDGRFSLHVIDAASGATVATVRGDGDTPVYDGSFVDDARIAYLGEIDGRFQVMVRGVAADAAPAQIVTDAPYAVLNARAVAGTLRFLNREGWQWTLDEVALPPAPAATPVAGADPAAATVADTGAVAGAAADTVAVADAAPAGPATTVPHVVSDEPYHLYDHLFIPTLHTIASYSPATTATLFGVGLSGSDRLAQNRWAVVGYLQPETREPAGQIAYLNAMLAPWLFQASASDTHWTETDQDSSGNDVRVHRQEVDASVSFGRTWRDSWSASVALTASGIHDRAACCVPVDLRLAGPGVALSYAGFESTAYAGARRGFAVSTAATWYPARLAEPGQAITDLRGDVDLALPVVGTLRHVIRASAIARDLVSSTSGLLELGGVASIPSVFQGSTDRSSPSYGGPDLPPLVTFAEVLRGYEDYPITTDRAAIAEAHWRWPLIVDRGWATSLYLLPATYVRELDVELFGAGAIDETAGARHQHAAAGAALTLRISLFHVPLSITYQVARRVRDDDAWAQLVGIGPGF